MNAEASHVTAEPGSILHTEAICLRIHPFSNTSRLVLWLARDEGRLATMIRGSQRPKSWFLGQYDLFYTCDLLYYARDRMGVHAARECAPLAARAGLRTDWRSCAAASYLCDLVSRTLPSDAPLAGAFERLESALDALAAGRPRAAVMSWFELQWLELLGYRPRLAACACGRPLPVPATRSATLAAGRGGVLCPACDELERGEKLSITPAGLDLMRAWQNCDSAEESAALKCGREAWNRVERALGGFLRHHLNLPLPSRDHALEILWSAEKSARGG